MDLEATLDVTPRSTISTLQSSNEIVNTLINAILITLTVVNINSIISKLIHLTHKDKFRYSSFLRVFIFHNSDDPALLLSWIWSWISQYFRDKKDKNRAKCKIRIRRLVAPLTARLVIFLATLGSIATSIPQDKLLKGCNQGDWYPDFNRRSLQGPLVVRDRDGPVCTEVNLETRLGNVRTRANFCSFPQKVPISQGSDSTIVVGYNRTSGVLYSGVQSDNGTGENDLQGTLSYVEWVDESFRNYRSDIQEWEASKHIAIVLDAINHLRPVNCELGESQEENGYIRAPVNCDFDAEEMSKTVDSFIRNSLRWLRTGTILERILPKENFSRLKYCPIDVVVSRPLLNMAPLGALLVMLFTLNLAVSFTTSERGEVLEQTFGFIREVMGRDCTIGPIEKSEDDDRGIEVAQRKRWVCSGGGSCHDGFLRGEDCDEVTESESTDCIVKRCKYADGSGKRVVNVGEDDEKKGFWRRLFNFGHEQTGKKTV